MHWWSVPRNVSFLLLWISDGIYSASLFKLSTHCILQKNIQIIIASLSVTWEGENSRFPSKPMVSLSSKTRMSFFTHFLSLGWTLISLWHVLAQICAFCCLPRCVPDIPIPTSLHLTGPGVCFYFQKGNGACRQEIQHHENHTEKHLPVPQHAFCSLLSEISVFFCLEELSGNTGVYTAFKCPSN